MRLVLSCGVPAAPQIVELNPFPAFLASAIPHAYRPKIRVSPDLRNSSVFLLSRNLVARSSDYYKGSIARPP